ncbi:3-keto-steroid reductase erg27-like protein [Cladobotryum mycophilum]|uniref:3-keto-steroid reductase erg27-like protein n=1 Tax=Cladobotryum mycophilum TaxID=491253 RepID=A0ABR0S7D6_9HYPO
MAAESPTPAAAAPGRQYRRMSSSLFSSLAQTGAVQPALESKLDCLFFSPLRYDLPRLTKKVDCSGIGLGIGQRLIDEFLATRSLTSHLILLPTTRSSDKSLQAIASLRQYAEQAAQTSTALQGRVGEAAYRWQDTVARIHVLSLSLDLCDLRGVYAFADRLCRGTVSNPEGLEGEYLRDVRIPRLDTVVFNAAYGGWTGCSYVKACWIMLTKGFVQAVTWPTFKNSLPTCILNERGRYNYPQKPLLASPLLSRKSQNEAPGRIVWSSSVEAIREVYNPDDMQCFLQPAAYESAKRLIDIIAISHSLPSVRPFSARFLQIDEESGGDATETPIPPRSRFGRGSLVGLPWHNCDGYRGAKSAAWIALQDQGALDEANAERIKWGSASDHKLDSYVKKTEVEGWGWEGKPETAETIREDAAEGILHKSAGRRAGTKNVMQEDIVEFEELGSRVWAEMERLRLEWASILTGKSE